MTRLIQRARPGGEALQALVDGLAEELGRSVVLDDPLVRMICTSRHFGDEDGVRVRTLLQGIADDETIRYVLAQGVAQWTRPGVLPGRDDLGLLARHCVPIRERGYLLGILMVVITDQELTSEQLASIDRAARAPAAVMYAQRLAADIDEEESRRLVARLVGSDSTLRCAAHGRLVDDGLLPDGPHVVVTGVAVSGHRDAPGQARVALRAARRLPRLAGIADWERLGEYAVLLQLPDSALNSSLLPKALRRLLDSGANAKSEETLRCFPENAGSVPCRPSCWTRSAPPRRTRVSRCCSTTARRTGATCSTGSTCRHW
ncbi:hypothetical protein [Kitasatospora griseola]|uniref:hypothetical protein n=1 Tax=Kitasatospora griseola TaxID=2064 RepID=UPI00382847B2